PWAHRQTIGRFRAFWRTVNLASFKPRKLAREMNCPLRLSDALAFRRAVVAIATLPLGAIVVIGLWKWLRWLGPPPWLASDRLSSVLQLLLIPFACICLWFCLLTVGGVQSYFFHPRSLSIVRQNRAIALSYYSFAPVAYTPLTLGLLVGGLWSDLRMS